MTHETLRSFETPEGLRILSCHIDRTAATLKAQVVAPSSYIGFDGHFPNRPILPAFVQVSLIIDLASRYMGSPRRIVSIGRARFNTALTPDTPYIARLTFSVEEAVEASISERNQRASSFRLRLEKTP